MFYVSDFKNLQSRNVVLKNEKSWKGWFSMKLLSEKVDEYCLQSTLHGLKYIRDPSLPRADRLFWLFIVLVNLYLSVGVIWEFYWSDYTDQFEMTLNPISTPIWDIPFPAIMICPIYSVRKSVFDIKKSANDTKFTFYSSLLCAGGRQDKTPNHTVIAIEEEYFYFVSKVAIPCEDLLVKCVWNGLEKDCCSLFNPIITSQGQCYVFNNLPGHLLYTDYSASPGSHEDTLDDRTQFWDINEGYPNRNGERWKTVYPYWTEFSGETTGLTVDLADNKHEWQKECSEGHTGYKLRIFAPNENPETQTAIGIADNVHTSISVTPTLIHSEKDLLALPKEKRGCLFKDECPLDYFKIYTQSSCFLECWIKHLIENCSCVPLVAQRFVGYSDHVYCSSVHLRCQGETSDKLLLMILNPANDNVSCGSCLPACSGLVFDYQSNSQPIVSSQTLPPWADGYNSSLEPNIARLSIYYKVQQFTVLTRRRTVGFSDFLGQCGGLLGLFLGFSFMSLIEVLYFAVIKPFNKIITYFIKH